MFLIIGLGNPDKKYSQNRHNVGFIAIDALHNRYNFSDYKEKFNGLFSKGKINNEDVVLVKPQTYMNNSGQCVGEFKRFFKLKEENIIILYDDLDLSFGKIKVKKDGSPGGHNGIKSIDSHIGKGYSKVKIGIDRPKNYNQSPADYVLQDFSKDEKIAIENKITPNIANFITLLFEGNESEFMNKLHLF